jgi:sortase A
MAAALVAVGLACLVWVGAEVANEAVFQRTQARALARIADTRASTPTPSIARPAVGEPIGTLEIPRVGLSAVVAEGDDDATLDKAVGHLPDTVLPWDFGNSALAGHRDTFFRPLKDVRVGDEVRLASPHGTFVYHVTEAFITTPDDIGVLAPRGKAELTLVTCYPFNYIGAAPKRYIVRAERQTLQSPE